MECKLYEIMPHYLNAISSAKHQDHENMDMVVRRLFQWSFKNNLECTPVK